MDEYINESAETQEVAEPVEDVTESAESQEVAEPEAEVESSESTEEQSGKTAQDAKFAEMRRSNQELEHQKEQLMQALSRYFDGETPEDLFINAMAYADQRDPEEYRQEHEQKSEFENLKSENEQLREQLFEAQADRLMRDDLAAIRKIDPSIESLDELGETFVKLRLNEVMPLSAVEAYYACKAHEANGKIHAPSAIGRVAETKTERDYFTSEEIDALTDEDLNDDKVWQKVMRSMSRL